MLPIPRRQKKNSVDIKNKADEHRYITADWTPQEIDKFCVCNCTIIKTKSNNRFSTLN